MNLVLIKRCGIGACALLVAAGCGGGGQGDDGPSLEGAVRANAADFLGGDATAAYARWSDRCRGVLAEDMFSAVVAQAAEQFRDAEITAYHEDVDGDKATVTYEFSVSALNQSTQPWVLEGGTWHVDDC